MVRLVENLFYFCDTAKQPVAPDSKEDGADDPTYHDNGTDKPANITIAAATSVNSTGKSFYFGFRKKNLG